MQEARRKRSAERSRRLPVEDSDGERWLDVEPFPVFRFYVIVLIVAVIAAVLVSLP